MAYGGRLNTTQKQEHPNGMAWSGCWWPRKSTSWLHSFTSPTTGQRFISKAKKGVELLPFFFPFQVIDFSHNILMIELTFSWRDPSFFGAPSNINIWAFMNVFPVVAWSTFAMLLVLSCSALVLLKVNGDNRGRSNFATKVSERWFYA